MNLKYNFESIITSNFVSKYKNIEVSRGDRGK